MQDSWDHTWPSVPPPAPSMLLPHPTGFSCSNCPTLWSCLLSFTWLLYSAWTHGQDISLGRELLGYLEDSSSQLPSRLLSSSWTQLLSIFCPVWWLFIARGLVWYQLLRHRHFPIVLASWMIRLFICWTDIHSSLLWIVLYHLSMVYSLP